MKRLTAKEEELMERFWEKGPLFVKELLACYDEPRPHFNTLSTIVRGLEEKGFLSHHAHGNTYQYYPLITAANYGQGNLRNVITKYFNNSYLGLVSSLIREEDLSVDDLRRLLDEVERGN
ncbi:MAG: BlaI/MecI/CopY family transcriptional regulator [Tannerellaceae bacterium]|jgi:predicted transcriptional regulator|nr:BlaI/MecI/CopY family transcriptional regulator [Tannerellaceae bacterium]